MTGTHRNKQWFSHGLVGKTFSKNALGKTPGGPSTGVKLTYDMIAGTPCGSGIPFYRGGTAGTTISLPVEAALSLIATLYRGMLRVESNESDCQTPFFRQIDDRTFIGILHNMMSMDRQIFHLCVCQIRSDVNTVLVEDSVGPLEQGP